MNIVIAFIISLIGSIVYLTIGMFVSLYVYVSEHRRCGKVDINWIGFCWCLWPIVAIIFTFTYLIGSVIGKPLGAVGNLTKTVVDNLVRKGELKL